MQPGQVWRKELSENESKEMIEFARSDPVVAAEAIAKGGRETLGFVHSSGILVRHDLHPCENSQSKLIKLESLWCHSRHRSNHCPWTGARETPHGVRTSQNTG